MKNNDMIFYNLKDKVPSNALLSLKESLDKASDDAIQRLLLINLKNAILGLIFSAILPGVDRIYKGDIILGIFKIIYFVVVYIGIESNLGDRLVANSESSVLAVLWLLAIVAMLAWFVADMFLVWKGIKRDNLKKIFEILEAKNG
ncbi:TM2 domain-containing protein [Helicobacter sp. 23-1045]